MDEVDKSRNELLKYWVKRREVCNGNVCVLWAGISKPVEENLLVYNEKTRKVLYSETLPMGMDADYNVAEIARQFETGSFESDGRYTGHPAGRYGPNGYIKE